MNEIKDTIAILKARWPEVFLIVGIQALSTFGITLLPQVGGLNSLLGLAIMACMLWLMLLTLLLPAGFLRTVHLEGPKRQSPLDLLRIGRHFLWRIVRLGLLWTPAYLSLAWIIFIIAKRPEVTDPGFMEIAETDPVVFCCCFAVARLILIKPALLILPIVIVKDCRIWPSFELLKRCKLADAEGPVALFVASASLPVLWAFLSSIDSVSSISPNIMRFLMALTHLLVDLMVAVAAVRYVGSTGLVQGENTGDSGSEDLP